eukprot:11953960-Prorocentrum_lima.AAC.1
MAVSTTRVVREVTAMLTLELRLTLMLSTTDAARVLTEVWVEVTEASATTLASHRRSSTESRPPGRLGVRLTFIGVLLCESWASV